jgi:hypothetical protein
VAHVVIDGAIDTEFIRSNFPSRAALKDRDGILSPDAIAEVYWQLHLQPAAPGPTRWTCAVDGDVVMATTGVRPLAAPIRESETRRRGV